MIPVELLRRYPFFAGFTYDQIGDLARVAYEVSVKPDHHFISEGERLTKFYLVLEGTVGVIVKVPDKDIEQSITRHIIKDFISSDTIVSTVNEGEIFGWSALITPNLATAHVKSLTACQVLVFDYKQLQPIIEKDCCFGHLLTLKAAQVIRDRLQDMHIESLSEKVI